jgi:hypothetical protein
MLSPETSTSRGVVGQNKIKKQKNSRLKTPALSSPPPLPSSSKTQTQEAKQAAAERQRQHVKENRFLKKITKIIPASWLGNGDDEVPRGKYKPAPPASASDDATGGFGGGGGSSSASAFAAGPPGVEKKE